MSNKRLPHSGPKNQSSPNERDLHVAQAQARSIERANPCPRAIAEGILDVCGVAVRCFVLDNGVRVLSARRMLRALGSGAKDGTFRRFLDRIASESEGLKVEPMITFRAKGGIHHGYPAELLSRICSAVTDLALAGKVHHKRLHLVAHMRNIEKAFGMTAILALVDEATGYQERRPSDFLSRKFAEYLLPVPGAWTPTFRQEFYDHLARLYRIALFNESERPQIFAGFTAKFIYEALEPDVARELRARNPEPHFGSNHHQHLTPKARTLLMAHISRVMTVMRQSINYDDFRMRFDHEFHGTGLQLSFGV